MKDLIDIEHKLAHRTRVIENVIENIESHIRKDETLLKGMEFDAELKKIYDEMTKVSFEIILLPRELHSTIRMNKIPTQVFNISEMANKLTTFRKKLSTHSLEMTRGDPLKLPAHIVYDDRNLQFSFNLRMPV